MALSTKAEQIYNQITGGNTKLGNLRTLAKEIKKDHTLAMELWATGALYPRLLAILIMDKKELTEELINRLMEDMAQHPSGDDTQLADWFMAKQLTKDRNTLALLESWEHSSAALKRRLFWYHQGRLRWVGQTPPDNTEELLAAIEERMGKEEPEVQWAMNFTTGWIGIFDEPYRKRCISIGEKLGLYKGKKVAKNCSPDYLPMFIETELAKRKL